MGALFIGIGFKHKNIFSTRLNCSVSGQLKGVKKSIYVMFMGQESDSLKKKPSFEEKIH